MSKHSSGTWRLKENNHAAPEIVTDERVIARVLYHGGSEDPEVDANARVLVAAKQMLEALEAVLACGWMPYKTIKGKTYCRFCASFFPKHTDICKWEKAKVALEAARGEK